MSSAGSEGVELVEKRKFDDALPKLNQALKTSNSPTWLLARSKCHIASGEFHLALRDADDAYCSATDRGSRPLMTEAQHRRAVALFRLGRPVDADLCCHFAMLLAEGVPMRDEALQNPVAATGGYWRPSRAEVLERLRLGTKGSETGDYTVKKFGSTWNTACAMRAQTIPKFEGLEPEDEARKPAVTLVPAKREGKDEDGDGGQLLKKAEAEKKKAATEAKEVRVDYFQSSTNISVSVFVKGVPKDEFQAQITKDMVRLSHIPDHDPKSRFEIPLHGEIDPSQSKYTVTPNKVELSLRKAEAVKWPTLRRDATSTASTFSSRPAATATPAVAAPPQPAAPAATTTAPKPPAAAAAAATAASTATTPKPSTSAKQPVATKKNWDKILSEEEVEDDSNINDFFKKLYSGATDEQRRAMTKSFVESNGTSLSTNWDDVKEGTVQTQPPEGVEAKKWVQ